MKKRKGRRSRHDHRGGEDDEPAKKAKAAGPDICDDVLLSIFSRLTSRDAARCAALSNHHRRLIGGVDFWLLHRRLSPPLPHPSIAYMMTADLSKPASDRLRPAAPLPDHALPRCLFLDFHLAGLAGGDASNNGLRYSLADRVHLHHRYVGTCNGVVLLAPRSYNNYNGEATFIVVFNPAIAGSEVAVPLELPRLPESGRYPFSGFGYGTATGAHKVLVTREERVSSRRPAAGYRAKELLVYTLGGSGGGGLPNDNHHQRLRPVPSPALGAKISGKSVYLDGKVYLLSDHSRVLVFDADDDTVAAVDLPGERAAPGNKRRRHASSKLMEVSGRLCVATGGAGDGVDRLALWLLAPDRQWVRLCELTRCGDAAVTKLAGAWDCGGVVLLYLFHRTTKVAYLHMYDTRTDEEFRRLPIPRSVAEQGGYGRVMCWGYRPTLVSPGSIAGAPPRQRGVLAAALNPLLERAVDAGRERTLDAVCFMNLLLYITTRLPDNAKDVITELKRKSLPFSLR